MQTDHNNTYINMARRRLIALICVLRAVIFWRGVNTAPRYTAPENGDFAVLPDNDSQGVLRENLSQRSDPPDILLHLLLLEKLRQPIYVTRPISGHDDRFRRLTDHLENENENEDVPSAILRKFENFKNRLERHQTRFERSQP